VGVKKGIFTVGKKEEGIEGMGKDE